MSLVGDFSEISRSWSPTIAGTCSLWQSRRPLQVHVVYGNLLESRRHHRTMFVLLVCDQCTILGTKNICDHWRSAATIVWWLYIGLRHIKDRTRSSKTSTIVARSQGGLSISYSVWLGSDWGLNNHGHIYMYTYIYIYIYIYTCTYKHMYGHGKGNMPRGNDKARQYIQFILCLF